MANNPQDISGQKRIWIVGSSIVHWAEQAAKKDDPQLGLDKRNIHVTWMGRRGLTMDGLDSILDRKSKELLRPHLILIHCGSNNIT